MYNHGVDAMWKVKHKQIVTLVNIFLFCGVILLVSGFIIFMNQFHKEKFLQIQGNLHKIGRKLEQYHHRYGRYPNSLAEIRGTRLKDRFNPSGAPYKYLHTTNDWTLYSIGPDHADNKGQLIYEFKYSPLILFTVQKGDIVVKKKDLFKRMKEKGVS